MRVAKALLRRVNHRVQAYRFRQQIDHTCRTAYFGSEYGGWRVATDQMDARSVVYSFGVGEDVSFDLALIDTFGLQVHAFDPTPKSIQWVQQQSLPSNFILHEYGIADFDGEVSFNPPENPDHVSHTLLARPATEARAIRVPVKRLDTIVSELGHERIDLLKMDVEGAEYAVIDDLAQSSLRPKQLLVEFHHRFEDVGADATDRAVRQLKQLGYALYHVSTRGEEFSFLHQPA